MAKGLFGRVDDELKAREKTPGLNVGELYSIEDATLRSLLIFMVREQETEISQLTAHTKKDENAIRALLKDLIEQGYVREIQVKDKVTYRVRLIHTKQGAAADVWQSLVSKILEEIGDDSK
jgi:DNA-binding IclR family transcriptional regulator